LLVWNMDIESYNSQQHKINKKLKYAKIILGTFQQNRMYNIIIISPYGS